MLFLVSWVNLKDYGNFNVLIKIIVEVTFFMLLENQL